MKALSLLFSLLLGAAVLLIFVQPWDALERMLDAAATREAAPAKPPTPPESTATVETTPPKPPETAAPQGAASPPEAPKAAEPADPKTHMLAAEKAEAERDAALLQKAAPPPPRETKRYFKVRVRDAGTLEAGLLPTDTVLIRLEGIEAREADESCKTESGKSWPCGAKARAALTLFIRYRAVTCTVPQGGETKDFAARCSVRGQDLSTWLVRQGWATPQGGAEPELAKALDAAKTERLGLWQSD
ncbi:thermonuclease family protein [Methyloceanibacter sp.]|uniref:thermonuclease family protein n=1 Tax=Methyloceanibacter sp. TaxID=1965321 RepID=UPI003D6D3555